MPQYRVDLHMHTTASSDGRSNLDKIVQSAKKKGLDAILISDHNVFSQPETKIIDGVLVMSGCEVSTTSGHILALFCRPFPVKELPKEKGVAKAIDAIRAIHEHGGIAVIAHPFQNAHRNLDDIAVHLDGAECANARVYMKNEKGNEMAKAFAERYGLVQTGGSDAHHHTEIANCYTLVEANSLEEIESAIRSGRTEAMEVKKTKRTSKGLSQMTSALRSKRIKKIAKASLVLIKGMALDLIGR